MGKMLFLVVDTDTHSKWPEVFIVFSTIADNTCLSSFFARSGYSISLVSNNAKQFTSAKFGTFLKNYAVKYMLSAPYYTGPAKIYLQNLQRGLKGVASGPRSIQFQMKLNNFLLQYTKMLHVTT